MLIGYARVSTTHQNLDLQINALTEAGCEKIYKDYAAGTQSNRPGLMQALEVLREEDTLVVWKSDRLGRSVKELIALINQLNRGNIHFKSLTDGVDTTTSYGRFFFHIMASLAEMEKELIAERTKAGLIAARAKGRVGGRKPKMTNAKLNAAKKLLADGIPFAEVADTIGVSLPTLYRWIPATQ